MIPRMEPGVPAFNRTMREQVAANRARTPAERFRALWDLLDSAAALAPTGERGLRQRARALALRDREREQMRAHLRQLIATGRAASPPGL